MYGQAHCLSERYPQNGNVLKLPIIAIGSLVLSVGNNFNLEIDLCGIAGAVGICVQLICMSPDLSQKHR
jgi:hypothetical protein